HSLLSDSSSKGDVSLRRLEKKIDSLSNATEQVKSKISVSKDLRKDLPSFLNADFSADLSSFREVKSEILSHFLKYGETASAIPAATDHSFWITIVEYTVISILLVALLWWFNRSSQSTILNLEREFLRMRTALDNVTTNIMMADKSLNIVYMNKSIRTMFQTAEEDNKKQFGNFNPSKLIGMNIDGYHKNPAHQRVIHDKFTDTFRS
ncbi:chemotaxis protein, partial [Leptospira bandrabouensis]|nr:chemotaxis protein [Leptospira bandrabouensis]